MSFSDIANSRYSCRNYDRNRVVERSILTTVIDTARIAPSACNRQPWAFVVIDDECDASHRKAIIKSYNRPWVESAPAFIVATPMWIYQSLSSTYALPQPMPD